MFDGYKILSSVVFPFFDTPGTCMSEYCSILISSWVRHCARNPNYSGPQQRVEGSLLWQEILGDRYFSKKKCVFSGKKKCLSAVPKKKKKQKLIKPLLKNSFPQISKALGHERVQFTLVGLFSGFTIAANFSRADPGAKRRKKTLFQKQLKSSKPKPFPKESERLLNPC